MTDAPAGGTPGGAGIDIIGQFAPVAKERRERVVTYTLVEVLTILVFIAASYGVLSKQEAEEDVMLARVEVEALEIELDELRLELAQTEAELERVTRQRDILIAALQAGPSPILPPDIAPGEMPTEDLEEAGNKLTTHAEEIQDAIEGGISLPACIASDEYLFFVDYYIDGVRARSTWPSNFNSEARRIPALMTLVSGELISTSDYGRLARQIRNSRTDCVFQIRSDRHHGDADVYQRQITASQQFYEARQRN